MHENEANFSGSPRGPRSIGKYTLIERIGSGGMATVYKAVFQGPEGFSKTVALKLILGEFHERDEYVRMFIKEATLVARLDHANIVRVHEFDRSMDGRYYIVMELVQGVNLALLLGESLQAGRLPSIPEALAVALEACRGLAYAHGELSDGSPAILHRDISPQNILVSETGEVKITDFGIAKLAESPYVTQSGVLKGKVAYLAPEQAEGQKLDKRCDIFSLGVVIWEMLAMKRLFPGANDYEKLNRLMKDHILPPSAHRPEIPPELDQVVLRMLERDRENRIHSASEVMDALSKILNRITSEDRIQMIRKMFQDILGKRVEESTREISAMGEEAEESLKASTRNGIGLRHQLATSSHGTPEFSFDLSDSFEAATDPDLPALRRISSEIPGKHRRLAMFWPVTVFLTLAIAATIIFGVFQSRSNREEEAGQGGNGKTSAVESTGSLSPPEAATASTASVKSLEEASALGADPPGEKNTESSLVASKKDDAVSREIDKVIEKPTPERTRKKKSGKRVAARGPFGRITVEVVPPGTNVYLGKKYLGKAPVKAARVPVGRHELTLVDSKGNKQHKWVNIREGKTASYVVVMQKRY